MSNIICGMTLCHKLLSAVWTWLNGRGDQNTNIRRCAAINLLMIEIFVGWRPTSGVADTLQGFAEATATCKAQTVLSKAYSVCTDSVDDLSLVNTDLEYLWKPAVHVYFIARRTWRACAEVPDIIHKLPPQEYSKNYLEKPPQATV